jgi:MotA/TolQ/ExbB proton channel family protein
MGLFARRQALGATVPLAAETASATRPLRSLAAVIGSRGETRDFVPFLRWLLVNSLAVVAFLALWRFGLVQTMLATERTYISLLILTLLVITVGHCLVQTIFVSRELVAARKAEAIIAEGAAGFAVARGRVATGDGRMLEPSLLSRHIANLVAKSRAQGGRTVDQTLLLRSLADQLRAREKLGWFVAEALLRLALLGTAIGFILMLIPIAQLSSFEVETLRKALAGMSGGMAIALNVTVTGIASALLLKVEYYFLNQAIAELFAKITEITEVYVVSTLERGTDG